MRYHMWSIISLFLVFSCQNNQKPKEDMQTKKEIIFNCLIYPTGSLTDTYFIELSDDGTITTTFGTKDTDKEDFVKIRETKTKVLSTSDINAFLNLKNEIVKMKEVKRGSVKKGGWEIIFKTNNKIYHFYYGDMNDNSLGEIIKKIKKMSPIKVDLHGWS